MAFLITEIRQTQQSIDEATSYWADAKSKVDHVLKTYVPEEESSSDIPTTERDQLYTKMQKRIDIFLAHKREYLKGIEHERDTLAKEISTLNTTLQTLSREFGGGDAQMQCSVCYDAPADTALRVCYHVFCAKCVLRFTTELGRCPTCRNTITGTQRLYF